MSKIDLKQSIKYMMDTGIFHDEQQALDILIASLKAFRDRLTKNKAFELGVQLPEALEKVYFEDWEQVQRKAESVNKSEFITEVAFHLKGYEDHDITDLVPAALNSVLNFIGRKDASLFKHEVPATMQDIFDDSQAM